MKYSIMYDLIENDITEKTILMCATIEHILTKKDLYICLKKWHNKYDKLDYGHNFKEYIQTKVAYDSYGILGAIRTIPYIYMNKNLEDTLELALNNSNKTHINDKSEKGVIALITTLYMIKEKKTKEEIFKEVEKYYDLKFHIKDIKKYKNEPSCENIIPYSIVMYLENKNLNDCFKDINYLKYNKSSFSIICGTMFYLENKTYNNNFYIKYLKIVPDEINELILKFENVV